MKWKYFPVFLSCVAPLVYADYQYESYFAIGSSETDARAETNIYSSSVNPVIMPSTSTGLASGEDDDYRLGLTYYLNPVDTSRLPLLEAGFFSKTSNLSAAFSKIKSNSDSQVINDTGVGVSFGRGQNDSKNFSLSSEYMIGSTPLFVGLNISRSESSSKMVNESLAFVSPIGQPPIVAPIVVSEETRDSENQGYGAKLGYYVGSNGRVFYQYSRLKSETELFQTKIKNESKTHQLAYRHIFPVFESQFFSVQLSGSKSKSSQNDIDGKSIGISYYPTNKLSFGYIYSASDHSGIGDRKTNYFSVNYFFNDYWSLGIDAEKSTRDSSSRSLFFDEIVSISKTKSDEEGLSARLVYRF